MAKIVKSAEAPEGPMNVLVGMLTFKLTDDEGYETTDPSAIDAGLTHPFLDVEYPELGGIKEATKAQTKEIRDRVKAEDKADKLNAEKTPYEAPVTADDVLDAKKETK